MSMSGLSGLSGLSALFGSAAAAQTYTQKKIALGPTAYWPEAEASGTTITDESGNGRNGVYSGVTLGATGIGDGRTAASYPGSGASGNIYSAGLAGAFNGDEGSFDTWMQVSAAGVWTDATARYLCLFQADANNVLYIRRQTTNNVIRFIRIGGSTVKTIDYTGSAQTTWLHLALTWSKSVNAGVGEQKAYVGGVQVGSTQTSLASFAGSLSSTLTLLGAGTIAGASGWSGLHAHPAVWGSALSAATVAILATVP